MDRYDPTHSSIVRLRCRQPSALARAIGHPAARLSLADAGASAQILPVADTRQSDELAGRTLPAGILGPGHCHLPGRPGHIARVAPLAGKHAVPALYA